MNIELAAHEAADFHGHMCPGLAVGVRAAELAIQELGSRSSDEELVAVVETDMCAVDAIQALTGCTFGKGNLIHRDYGKNAFSFFRRSDGRAIRIVSRPAVFGETSAESQGILDAVWSGKGTPEQRSQFKDIQGAKSKRILNAALADLFDVQPVTTPPPPKANIHKSIACARCGEQVMATRIVDKDGLLVCAPCAAVQDAATLAG